MGLMAKLGQVGTETPDAWKVTVCAGVELHHHVSSHVPVRKGTRLAML